METFDFPYHRVETQNPESGLRVQFGGSYTFTSAPSYPDQRLFKLSFPTMKYFTDENNELDETINAEYNMYALILFYREHKQHKTFLYNHPIHGEVTVKFKNPLVEPRGIPGGSGAVEGFDVELMEIPS